MPLWPPTVSPLLSSLHPTNAPTTSLTAHHLTYRPRPQAPFQGRGTGNRAKKKKKGPGPAPAMYGSCRATPRIGAKGLLCKCGNHAGCAWQNTRCDTPWCEPGLMSYWPKQRGRESTARVNFFSKMLELGCNDLQNPQAIDLLCFNALLEMQVVSAFLTWHLNSASILSSPDHNCVTTHPRQSFAPVISFLIPLQDCFVFFPLQKNKKNIVNAKLLLKPKPQFMMHH